LTVESTGMECNPCLPTQRLVFGALWHLLLRAHGHMEVFIRQLDELGCFLRRKTCYSVHAACWIACQWCGCDLVAFGIPYRL